jgi:hypothetical protein
VLQSLTIQAVDEYNNERHVGGDNFVVRAVPYNAWDAMQPFTASRALQDCTGCPRTVYGAVQDMGDASYQASFNGTKRGSYKLLASLALSGGLFATYYSGALVSTYYSTPASKFHRLGQVGDSYLDFPSACVKRNAKAGVQPSTFECASPGYDFADSSVELIGTAGTATINSLELTGGSAVAGYYVGMYVVITNGPATGNLRRISAYDGSAVATVDSSFTEIPTAAGFKVHLPILILLKREQILVLWNLIFETECCFAGGREQRPQELGVDRWGGGGQRHLHHHRAARQRLVERLRSGALLRLQPGPPRWHGHGPGYRYK